MSSPAPGGAVPPGPQRTHWPSVAFGVSLGVLAAYQQFKLPPALPLLFEQYAYPRVLAGAFMSVYALTGLLFSVAIGARLGREGPKRLLRGAFALLVAGNLVALAAPGLGGVMLAGRLLEGLAFAVLAVVGGVLATDSAVGRDKLIAVALWATWIPLGQVLSSVLAIPLVGAGLWRPLWWAGLLATAAIAGAGRWLGIGSDRTQVGCLHGTRPDAGPVRAEGAETRARKRSLLLAAGLFALWTMQFLAFMSWLPQFLVEARGFAPGRAALVYLFPPLLIVGFNLATGVMLRSGVPLGRLLPGSIAVQAGVWLLLPVLGPGVSGALALVAYGITCGITPTCLFALPNAILGDGQGASRGFAAILTGRNLGALIGPMLLAQAVTLFGGWNVLAPLFGGLCIAAVATATVLCRRL